MQKQTRSHLMICKPLASLIVKLSAIAVAFVLLSGCIERQAPTAKVIKVPDGDTIVVELPNKKQLSRDIRYVDAPEREQPFGREAQLALSALLLNAELPVDVIKREQLLTVDDQPVALKLVASGTAWVEAGINDPAIARQLVDAQRAAQNAQLGLWGQDHALLVPPWTWRRQSRHEI